MLSTKLAILTLLILTGPGYAVLEHTGLDLTRAQGRVCGTPSLGEHYEIVASLLPTRTGDELEGHTALGVKPKNRVGDQRVFWSFDLSVMPPQWIQVPATCRGIGPHCYVFIADDQWDVNMDREAVQEVLYRFNESTPGTPGKGIYALDTEMFGAPPDELDEDPRIYIFYSGLGSYAGIVFDGYFDPMNELTEEQAQRQGGHSNEVEMFYMSCDPVNPVAPSTLSVLAHEFEHMIHWNWDRDESAWVDEGCAEIAMLFYGVPDPITGFPGRPDNSLVEWDQEWADYVKSYLFTLYFFEHYGAEAAVDALVKQPLNSVSGYEQTLQDLGYDIDFDDLFCDWTLANLLDDPTIGDGRWGYEAEDLPTFYSKPHPGYPVDQRSGTTEHWACDYQRFDYPGELTRAYYFDGEDEAFFRCFWVLEGDGINTEVREIELHADLYGNALLPPGGGVDTPYLIVNNCSPSLSKSYVYGTDLAFPIEARASDAEIPEPGIDADDEVMLVFSFASSEPLINETTVDSLLELSGGHSWLDGAGDLGGAFWHGGGDTLTILLSTNGGGPTIAEGDTILSLIDDARFAVILEGSFSPTGVADSATPAPSFAATRLSISPNPFNPRTNLGFDLNESAWVELQVYDLAGRWVATPFAGRADAGHHAVTWHAQNLASGVYVAELNAGGLRSTRKLLLLK